MDEQLQTDTDSAFTLTVTDDSEDEEVESSTSSCMTNDSSTTSTVLSIMNGLRAPKPSDIARKRKTRVNPPKGKRRSCSRGLCDPKFVTPSQHVKEHSGEELVVSNGKLFCQACREELSLKANIVKNHIKSGKHKYGKQKLKSKEAREGDISVALQAHNEKTHQEGESLPISQQVYRVKVVTAFLQAGIPINKDNCFRQLLEENAYRLTDRSHMANLIAFIVEQEKRLVKQEIGSRSVSVIFDGTTRLGEAMVVVIRAHVSPRLPYGRREQKYLWLRFSIFHVHCFSFSTSYNFGTKCQISMPDGLKYSG